jgi:hypothetical protein
MEIGTAICEICEVSSDLAGFVSEPKTVSSVAASTMRSKAGVKRGDNPVRPRLRRLCQDPEISTKTGSENHENGSVFRQNGSEFG